MTRSAIGFWFMTLVFLAWLGIGSAVTLANWEGQLVSPGIERAYFEARIANDEPDYLHAMRDTHLGCETLAYRNPEIVFFGDSHSYAGWDYPQLQASLDLKVGNCALSGAFPENLPDLIAAIRRAAIPVRYLVIGISPRMFWDVPERQDRIARARAQIADIGRPLENLVTLATGDWRQIDVFPPIDPAVAGRLEMLDQTVRALPQERIDRFLSAHADAMHATAWWQDYTAEGTSYAAMPDVTDDICHAIESSGIALGVVYIPESRWLASQYSPAQQSWFTAMVDRLKRCATLIHIDEFPAGGDNRWYINRYAAEDYPYGAWSDFDLLDPWIAVDETQRRWQFFDPDHLSPFGASAFTAAMLPELIGWTHSN